jgi:hypothetical protein
VKCLLSEIEIDAGREAVWRILTDFAAYPEWNPLLVRVDGHAEPGTVLRLRVRSGRREVDLAARVGTVTRPAELRWAGPPSRWLGLLFRAEHWFRIEEISERRCRFVHGEDFAGLLLPLALGWIERRVVPGHQAMNEALRRRATGAS